MKNFLISEFKCRCKRCGSTGAEMDDKFLSMLDDLRDHLQFPLIVSSGYRCPNHNISVSKSGPHGPHTTGKAADIAVFGAEAYNLVKTALSMGFSGIGVKQLGSARYIHLDILENSDTSPRPRIWSY